MPKALILVRIRNQLFEQEMTKSSPEIDSAMAEIDSILKEIDGIDRTQDSEPKL